MDSPSVSAWIGYDSRMPVAFAVARHSLRMHDKITPVRGLVLSDLQARGLYYRPTERKGSQLWDVISDAPMSTEFSISRFLVPHLAEHGLALFCDSDVMFLDKLTGLFNSITGGTKAVYCVKHDHSPGIGLKMDGQAQTRYHRKNWSSVMVFNCDHPANKRLTVEMVNELPGRDLHAFCWLDDDEIGELDPGWNYLVGYSKDAGPHRLVHFTEGLPDMEGYEDQLYADRWLAMRPAAVGAI